MLIPHNRGGRHERICEPHGQIKEQRAIMFINTIYFIDII